MARLTRVIRTSGSDNHWPASFSHSRAAPSLSGSSSAICSTGSESWSPGARIRLSTRPSASKSSNTSRSRDTDARKSSRRRRCSSSAMVRPESGFERVRPEAVRDGSSQFQLEDSRVISTSRPVWEEISAAIRSEKRSTWAVSCRPMPAYRASNTRTTRIDHQTAPAISSNSRPTGPLLGSSG